MEKEIEKKKALNTQVKDLSFWLNLKFDSPEFVDLKQQSQALTQ